MTLKERREQWEKGGELVLEVVDSEGSYKTVLVVVKFVNENPHYVTYSTLRYSPNYGTPECNWEVSADYQGNDLQDALAEIMNYSRDRHKKLLVEQEPDRSVPVS